MADSSIPVLDAGGTSRPVDAQTVGTDYQQTVTLGDGANAGRIAAVDSDGAVRVETNIATTATKTNVTSSVTSGTILASNTNRRAAFIYNDSTAILYLSYGTSTTSATSFSVKLQPDTMHTIGVWTGALTGMWATANGAARVTDLSA